MVGLLRSRGVSNKVDSSSGSIGRRYARNDEVGTPFGITVDFDSIDETKPSVYGTVTLRERDSTKQIRGKVEDIVDVVARMCFEEMSWESAVAKFGEYSST